MGSATFLRPQDFSYPGAASAAMKSRRALRRGTTIEWAIFCIFVAALGWLPLAGNLPLTWGINAILFPGLAVIYEISVLARRVPHPVALKEFPVSAALFVAVVLWIIIQNGTWTPSFLHHPIWGMAANALDRPVEGSISVNRDLTTLALVRLVTAASVFWLAVQLCRSEPAARTFMMAFIAISSGYAIYGLVAFAMAHSAKVPLEHSSLNFVTSTFYDHNHYATYAGMGLVAVCGLILRIYQREVPIAGGSFRFKIATFIEASGRTTALLLGSAFLLLLAVLLTGSRGGIVAMVIGVSALGVLTLGRHMRGAAGLRGAIVIGVVLIASIVVFSGALVSQINENGLPSESIWAAQTITLRSIFDSPLLGYGYGTFADVFPMFRDRSVGVLETWEQAQNTYLEAFQGLGLVFGSLLFASVILLVFRCFKGATGRQEGMTIPSVAVSAAALVGVHSLVEFSMQIQAVALTFMALLGAGVAQSKSSLLTLSD